MERLYYYRAKMKMYAEGTAHAQGQQLRNWQRAERQMKRIGLKIDKLTHKLLHQKDIKKQKPGTGTGIEGQRKGRGLFFIRVKVHPVEGEVEADANNNADAVEKGLAGSTKAPATSGKGVSGKNASKGDGRTHAAAAANNVAPLEDEQALQVNDTIVADSVASFVTFEYSESMARCVEDHSYYSRFPQSLFYPDHLKFRGCRLRVRKAPEPDELVWENLETGRLLKTFHRLRTALVTLVLMVACFAITLQASIYKQRFTSSFPSARLCNRVVPALYASAENRTDYSGISLARAVDSLRTQYDALCDKAVPGSFYGIYAIGGAVGRPVGDYDYNACSKTTAAKQSLNDYGKRAIEFMDGARLLSGVHLIVCIDDGHVVSSLWITQQK
jgi:hypothetical protein